MSNIRIEMNYYYCVNQWVVMVLFDDTEGVSSSYNWYFRSRSKAALKMTSLEVQYSVKGTINK